MKMERSAAHSPRRGTRPGFFPVPTAPARVRSSALVLCHGRRFVLPLRIRQLDGYQITGNSMRFIELLDDLEELFLHFLIARDDDDVGALVRDDARI